jgi:hypothetical protein
LEPDVLILSEFLKGIFLFCSLMHHCSLRSCLQFSGSGSDRRKYRIRFLDPT